MIYFCDLLGLEPGLSVARSDTQKELGKDRVPALHGDRVLQFQGSGSLQVFQCTVVITLDQSYHCAA
jgi:hypothetical protein